MKILNFTNSFTQKFSDPLLNVTVFKKVLPEDFQDKLINYSESLFSDQKMSKNPTGDGRYRKRFLNDDIPPPLKNLISELDDKMKLYNGSPDTYIGNILTYNLPGSYIQSHQDDYGDIQLRINILASKEEYGGNPIISGFMYKINSGDAWAFSPSNNLHGTSYITKSVRINLSLGWNFKNKDDYLNAFVSLST